MKKVLVVGSLNMDLVVGVDRFPDEGETILGNNLMYHVGGKGANQASAAVLQNVPTAIWGCLGNDLFAQTISKSLENLGIVSYVDVVDTHTGLALIETDRTGLNRIVVVGGANKIMTPKTIKQKIQLLDEFDVIVLQNEIPVESIELLIVESRKRNKIVIYNPAPYIAISEDILTQVDYLIPNEHELSLLIQKPMDTEEEIKQGIQKLHHKGIDNVIVTLGSQGVLFSHQHEYTFLESVKVKVVDTTGAGDAFVGSFAAGLVLFDNDAYAALIYANKSAAISVTKKGAFGSAGSKKEIEILS
ncbi:MAG: ribokinase [Brevinema sp.]